MLRHLQPTRETQARFFRFLVVGGLAALVQFSTLWAALHAAGPDLSFTLSFVCSTATHYLLNRAWALPSHRRDSWRQLLEYLGVALLSYLVNIGLFKFCRQGLGLPEMASAMIALPPSTLLVFLLLHLHVFRRHPRGPGKPAVFLDRDGTLNRQVIREGRPYPPASLEDFELLPGVAEACRALHGAGFSLVVVTNQPDVGRGSLPPKALEAMHARLKELIPEIERIEVSTEPSDEGEPRRRKPRPGMLLDASEALHLDLARSWMVGDRWKDIDCGKRAGVKTIFLDYSYEEKLREAPDFRSHSLREATDIILSQTAAARP